MRPNLYTDSQKQFYTFSSNMSQIRFQALLFLALLASACLIKAKSISRLDADLMRNDEEGVDQIIGGTAVPKWQHNYMAYLKSFYPSISNGYLACGGTVISNRYILTAAHCLYNKEKTPYEKTTRVEVYLKVHTVKPMEDNRQPIVVTGSNIKPHRNYLSGGLPNYSFDIALLKLSQDLPSNYEWIKLFKPVYQGDLTAVGWGRTSSSGSTSATMQQVDFQVGTEEECQNSWGYLYSHSYQLCGVTPNQSTCQGDSGGPVVHYNIDYQMYSQVGITSFGHADANNNALCEMGFAVYTRVSAHYQWIHENSCYQADGGLCPNWAQV